MSYDFPETGSWNVRVSLQEAAVLPSLAVIIKLWWEGLGRGSLLIACCEKFEDCASLAWSVIVWLIALVFCHFTHKPSAVQTVPLIWAMQAICWVSLHHFLVSCIPNSWFAVAALDVVVSVCYQSWGTVMKTLNECWLKFVWFLVNTLSKWDVDSPQTHTAWKLDTLVKLLPVLVTQTCFALKVYCLMVRSLHCQCLKLELRSSLVMFFL